MKKLLVSFCLINLYVSGSATIKKNDLAKIYPFEVKVIIESKKGKAMIDQLKTYSLGRIIENSFMGKITEKEKILFDNHRGKPLHYHENGKEKFLEWISLEHTEKLFYQMAYQKFGYFNYE